MEKETEGWSLKPKDRFLDINLDLRRYGGVRVAYDPKSGLRRQMHFRGYLKPIESDERFEGKSLFICLETPPEPEFVEKTRVEAGVVDACGILSVRAGVEPTEWDQQDGFPPIFARVAISPNAFDAVSAHASATLERLGRAEATIRLVGKSLPETGSGSAAMPIHITDLDVSADKSYAIGSFEVGGTRTYYPLNRVLPVKVGWGERDGTRISILLTSADFRLDVPTGQAHSVRCHGTVVENKEKAYGAAKATVTFEEFHAVSATWGLPLDWGVANESPETALFGEFDYWPKNSDDEPNSEASFSFELKNLPDDTRDLIIPILQRLPATQIFLNVVIANKETDLLATMEHVKGNVRYYGFTVRTRHDSSHA